MIPKISLGTVQFGQNYGIANTHGQVTAGEVAEILDFAQSVGIKSIDTAYTYGNRETVIGAYLKKNHSDAFDIVSKLQPLEKGKAVDIQAHLKRSLERLEVGALHGYLVHRYEDIMEHNDLWGQLIKCSENGLVKKVGFSLYS